MMLILVFIFVIFLFYRTETIIRYGKGIIKPDFERVDRMFAEKQNTLTRWNTSSGRVVYYCLLLFSLVSLILFLFLLYRQIINSL